jgi:hypothetical protein
MCLRRAPEKYIAGAALDRAGPKGAEDKRRAECDGPNAESFASSAELGLRSTMRPITHRSEFDCS